VCTAAEFCFATKCDNKALLGCIILQKGKKGNILSRYTIVLSYISQRYNSYEIICQNIVAGVGN